MKQYVFDKASFSFKKASRTFWNVTGVIVKYAFLATCIAAVNYLIFAFFINTDTEKRLLRENNMYAKVYDQMLEREQLVGDVVSNLKIKDNQIYNDIFNSDAPDMDPVDMIGFVAQSDSIPDSDLVAYTARKADGISAKASVIGARLADITAAFSASAESLPPLSIPLRDISYAQVGASLGDKVNPFYKVPVSHYGVDLIAPQGDPVLASAPGYVSNVISSRKGQGNVVEITHPGGYVTRYAHLADVQVRKGNNVRKGTCLGYVGISGNSFAPHLHYEVLRDSTYLNPVNHFFASVSPEEYMNMLYMSVSTGQSMD